MRESKCGVNYEDVKSELLREDPELALEYRKLETAKNFSVLIMKEASRIAEERSVPAEEIDKEIAEKSGLGIERYTAIMGYDVEASLGEIQLIAMAFGCDAKVVFFPHKEQDNEEF